MSTSWPRRPATWLALVPAAAIVLLGLALADAWARSGAPAPCVLAELGPGRLVLLHLPMGSDHPSNASQDWRNYLGRLSQGAPWLYVDLIEALRALPAAQASRLAAWAEGTF